jgi:N-acetylneuraminate synthase
MRELFDAEVGLSDHTMGVGAALAGIALGATVIEKHFTLSRSDGGVDSAFSMEPAEMSLLVTESKRAWQALGRISYGPGEQEKTSLSHRRSLYITKDLQAGDILTKDNVRAIRPGLGLSPKYFDIVLGKKVNQTVKMGSPLSWDLIT